jgi:hypothetical protein
VAARGRRFGVQNQIGQERLQPRLVEDDGRAVNGQLKVPEQLEV